MKILVLGVTGMLGSAVFKVLSSKYEVWGTLRDSKGKLFFADDVHKRLIPGVDVLKQDELVTVLSDIRPDVVINCIGLIKQLPNAKDPLVALPINAMFPHRLARLCGLIGARIVHISTDCVFSGDKGLYVESDSPDASDLYGRSKHIGELTDYSHCITLRTSIIGHELGSRASLIDWFLAQKGQVKGFKKAVFSGLPTVELARVIGNFVLPNTKLSGLYHVSASPIDKYSLLLLVAEVYGKNIDIVPNESFQIDRSLDSSSFKDSVGYESPSWMQLVEDMYINR